MDSPSRSISQPELLENLAWVQALARSLVAEQSAALDVVQDTWMLARERPPRHTTGPGLRAWLARVTRTVARKYNGAEALLDRRPPAFAGAEVEPSTVDVVIRVAQQKTIIEAVMSLDEPDRSTVLLRYVDGLNASAIAERVGEKPAAIRQRLSRALAKLRGQLEREFDGEEGGWVRVLTPFALQGLQGATIGKAGVLGGAIVMKASYSIGFGVAALLLGATYLLWGEDPGSALSPGKSLSDAGLPLVAAREKASNEVLLSPPEKEVTEPAREVIAVEETLPGALFELLDPEGQALPAAKLFLCLNGEIVARGLTDEAGEFATEVSAEENAWLLIQAAGVCPVLREVTLAPVRQVIQLEEGAVVSGWIVVDGNQPSELIPLRLRASQDLVPLRDLLGVSLEELGINRMAPKVSNSHAAEDGSFRFYGLPDDWSGSLDLPQDYHIADPLLALEHVRFVLPVGAPVQGLRVEVTKQLALTGRIIETTEGEPVAVPGAWIKPHLKYAGTDLARAIQSQIRADEEGRFRFAALASDIEGGTLMISPPDQGSYRVLPVEARDIKGDVDLGDLALLDLRGGRTLTLLVKNTDGLPIEGAVAEINVSSPVSAPTGADGRTSLAIENLSTFVVHARGYQPLEVHAPADRSPVLTATLLRAALLEIEFRTPDGKVARRLQVRISAAEHPYREEGSQPSVQAIKATGCSISLIARPAGSDVVLCLGVGREGKVIVNDLEASLSLHLRIHARQGRLLQEQDIAPLGPTEWRSMVVVLSEVPRTLWGRILDEKGEPLPGASAGMSSHYPDRPNLSMGVATSVQADGSFEYTDIYSDTVAFNARAHGFVSFKNDKFPVPQDGSAVEIRLAPAHIVTVFIQDVEGRGVPGEVHAYLPSGNRLYGKKVEGQVGAYIVRGLPNKVVTFRTRVHGHSYMNEHDPLVPELRIDVPLLGSVEASISGPRELELDGWCYLWLFPTDDTALVPLYARKSLAEAKPAVLPAVLPGTYEVVIRRFLQGDFPSDASFEEIDASFFEELTPRHPLVVRPGETTRIELEF